MIWKGPGRRRGARAANRLGTRPDWRARRGGEGSGGGGRSQCRLRSHCREAPEWECANASRACRAHVRRDRRGQVLGEAEPKQG